MNGRFYLIGHPLGHSFSPSLHRLFGNDRYSLMDLEEDAVGPFLESREFDGLNVTIPYKRTVIPFMDGGTIYDRGLYGELTALAAEKGIPWQTKTWISGGTDASASWSIRKTGAPWPPGGP